MSVPDPNNFEGAVRVCGAGEDGWTDVPLAYREGGRGMGPGRDGVGDTQRPPAARRRTALQPRPRRHARGARVLGLRHARRHDNHVRAPCHHPRRTAGGRLRPMTDASSSGGRKLVPRRSRLSVDETPLSARDRSPARHAGPVGRPAARLRPQRRPRRVLVHGVAPLVDRAETAAGRGTPRKTRGAGGRGDANRTAGVRRRRPRRLVQRRAAGDVRSARTLPDAAAACRGGPPGRSPASTSGPASAVAE